LIFEGFEYDSIHFLAAGTVTRTFSGFSSPFWLLGKCFPQATFFAFAF
jgi:hypothetical protein